MKEGSIALIPDEKVPIKFKVGDNTIQTEQEVIFLNSISIPGLSGAPIFLWPGPRVIRNSFAVGGTKPLLLGIMHGFYNAIPQEVTKIETTESKWFYQDNSGIAIVYPSWKIKDILTQKQFLKRMDELKGMIK
jgi:hypothetical protein